MKVLMISNYKRLIYIIPDLYELKPSEVKRFCD